MTKGSDKGHVPEDYEADESHFIPVRQLKQNRREVRARKIHKRKPRQ